MLHFINNQIWKVLFGRVADGLERSWEDEDEYRILDRAPITNRYTSLGAKVSLSGPNCAAFVAGIIQGVLEGVRMDAKVETHQ